MQFIQKPDYAHLPTRVRGKGGVGNVEYRKIRQHCDVICGKT